MEPSLSSFSVGNSQTQSSREYVEPEERTVYPTPPKNVGSVPFSVLVDLFENLQKERKPERRQRLLNAWFNHWRQNIGYDLYPVLRLILPQKDRERAVYGLKEKNLAKAYIKIIGLGTKDPDAIRLINWKKPTERYKSSGDFPAVLYEVISKRSSVTEGTLSVEDLNNFLDEIAKSMGKQDAQAKILQRIYNRATSEEQLWVVRIILKDMVISVKETTVFSVFHQDAQDLFNTCSDLKKVAWEVWDPARRLNEEDKTVQIFRAFAPMLCKRPTTKVEETAKEMQGKKFIIEEKLDGERIQLHKRGNEYFYCSRKGKDYTYLYGKHVGAGSLTPYIHEAFDERVEEIILDGEMLVWDPVSEKNLPFGTLKTAALDKSRKQYTPRPCFMVFDMLYLNGISLLQKSVKYRKRNLRACLCPIPGRIEFTIEFEGKTAKDIRDRMDEIMANRGEGLVIKHPDSQYILNGRNKDWIKVKPEYMDNMGETVDVLVTGGHYGSGKRSGGVSTLVCSVLDDRRPEDDEEPKYSTFVRIGSGLSFADYVWIRAKAWKEFDPKYPPSFLQTAKKGREDKGDVYLEPQDSFILKVKAAEITTSDQYHVGITMRFPRALSIRDDLGIEDCMTASAVLESVRTDKKRRMEQDATISSKKRKTANKKIMILPEYRGSKFRDIETVSELFKDMTFHVSSDPNSRTGGEDKRELLRLIRANGGKTVEIIPKHHPKPVPIIYGGTVTPYDLKLSIDRGYDVVKPQWLLDCVSQKELVPLKKRYFFHASETRKATDEYNLDGETEAEEETQTIESHGVEEIPHLPVDGGSELSGWFKTGDANTPNTKPDETPDESQTESDADSDNQDVRSQEGDDGELFQVKDEEGDTEDQPVQEPISKPRMGETEDAMNYDQDRIFTHLCFYLDSPQNAKKHGMATKSKREEDLNASFTALSNVIIENGGRVVDLGEPKLTHVVVDKRDISRRVELVKRTSIPKRRNIVVAEFVHACLEEGTLLDEDGALSTFHFKNAFLSCS